MRQKEGKKREGVCEEGVCGKVGKEREGEGRKEREHDSINANGLLYTEHYI